jgi:hypothetical protein
MTNLRWPIVLICLVGGSPAAGQTGSSNEFRSVTQVYDKNVKAIERTLTAIADMMPEDKYSFVPSNGEFNGVRSFAEMAKHVAVDNYMNGAALLREKVPIDVGVHENGPDTLKTKPQIMKFLSDSFEYLDKAVNTVDEKNLMAPVKDPWGGSELPRLLFVNSGISHPWDLYGQMVEYLRMNGIDPQRHH